MNVFSNILIKIKRGIIVGVTNGSWWYCGGGSLPWETIWRTKAHHFA